MYSEAEQKQPKSDEELAADLLRRLQSSYAQNTEEPKKEAPSTAEEAEDTYAPWEEPKKEAEPDPVKDAPKEKASKEKASKEAKATATKPKAKEAKPKQTEAEPPAAPDPFGFDPPEEATAEPPAPKAEAAEPPAPAPKEELKEVTPEAEPSPKAEPPQEAEEAPVTEPAPAEASKRKPKAKKAKTAEAQEAPQKEQPTSAEADLEELVTRVFPEAGMPKEAPDYSQATPEEVYGTEEAYQVNDPAAQSRKTGFEYIEEFQRDALISNYRKKDLRKRTGIFALAILLLVTVLYECLYGVLLPDALSPSAHPMLYLLFDDLLALGALAIVHRPLIDGLLSVLRRKPQPSSMVFLLYAVTFLYQVIAWIGGAAEQIQYSAISLVLLCLCTAIADRLELRREVYAFAQMSTEGEKLLLRRGADADTYYTQEADFLSDFYHNSRHYPAARRVTYLYLILSLTVFFAFLLLPLCMGVDFFSSMRCAYMALLVTAPLSLLLLFTLPQFLFAQRLYLKQDATVLSEEVTERLAKAHAVEIGDAALLDVDGIRITDFKIYGNYRVDYAMQCMASVLDCIPCTLSRAFCRGVEELGYSQNHTLTELTSDGVACIVDGKVQVELGTAEYMRKQQRLFTVDPVQEKAIADGQVGVAYLAVDGEIVAVMHIHYKVSEGMLQRLSRLSEEEISLVIRTQDPILNETVLRRSIPQGNRYRIFLHKIGDQTMPKAPRADGIAMTTVHTGEEEKTDELRLLDAILGAIRLQKLNKTARTAVTFGMIVSLFVMAFLQNPCLDRVLRLTTYLPALYQLVAGGIMSLVLYRLYRDEDAKATQQPKDK